MDSFMKKSNHDRLRRNSHTTHKYRDKGEGWLLKFDLIKINCTNEKVKQMRCAN